MSTLPDEILSEILSPALKVSDELFSDTSDVSPFAKYSPSTSAYLVVCRDWLRVATPLLYNVGVLRSKSQANALEKVLETQKEFGRFIKKLRVKEGTEWRCTLTKGLCKGLPLINPHRVILVDPKVPRPLKNKHLAALSKVILSCIGKWNNLRVFDFPYLSGMQYRPPTGLVWEARATDLAEVLARSQVHTILLAELWRPPTFLIPLSQIPTVQILQLKAQPWVPPTSAEDTDSHVPEIAPFLNPFFIPMESAFAQTREIVWKRVLFFAMDVEERRSLPHTPAEARPSRLPLLLVSKCFNRLALPYLYDCLNLKNPISMHAMVQQLKNRPDLGSFIRSILCPGFYYSPDTMLTLVSYATNAQIVSAPFAVYPDCFEALAKTTGSSLRELTICFENCQINTSLFTHFPELCTLELGTTRVTFHCDSTPEDVLSKLHTIHSPCFVIASLAQLPGYDRLQSLRTLRLDYVPLFSDRPSFYESVVKFLKAQRRTLLHLKLAYDPPNGTVQDFNLFDVCKELLDVEFIGHFVGLHAMNCEAPHSSLTKIILNGNPFNHSDKIDPAMFSALREIQFRFGRWPTTEREISKNLWVELAEAWLKHGIKLTDETGQHWIPRMKRSRGQ
ncbi:hypothetical protein B0H19DRAFT_1256639 [Mycena capillaripes]|nr:hypothetical protein B0H19DRAFT_1256639 [Mycena capillaripes]